MVLRLAIVVALMAGGLSLANSTIADAVPGDRTVPRRSGAAHVILEIRDNGSPKLTSYRRIVMCVSTAGSGASN